jgi:hypothetical protein
MPLKHQQDAMEATTKKHRTLGICIARSLVGHKKVDAIANNRGKKI